MMWISSSKHLGEIVPWSFVLFWNIDIYIYWKSRI